MKTVESIIEKFIHDLSSVTGACKPIEKMIVHPIVFQDLTYYRDIFITDIPVKEREFRFQGIEFEHGEKL